MHNRMQIIFIQDTHHSNKCGNQPWLEILFSLTHKLIKSISPKPQTIYTEEIKYSGI